MTGEVDADGVACGYVGYFGYGSLVNRLTHRTAIVSAHRARLNGWRRLWRPRPDMPFDRGRATPVSLLTVTQEPGAHVDGLLIIDHAENLPSVDLREQRYRRRKLQPGDITLSDGDALPDCTLYVYEALEALPEHAAPCPIYQSYLDAVLQGFIAEHGEAGARDFVFATGGFDIPVLADRNRPLYPRSITLSDDECRIVDSLLAERGISYIPV